MPGPEAEALALLSWLEGQRQAALASASRRATEARQANPEADPPPEAAP